MKNLFNKIMKIYNQHREVILYLIFGVLTTLVNLIVKNELLFFTLILGFLPIRLLLYYLRILLIENLYLRVIKATNQKNS